MVELNEPNVFNFTCTVYDNKKENHSYYSFQGGNNDIRALNKLIYGVLTDLNRNNTYA